MDNDDEDGPLSVSYHDADGADWTFLADLTANGHGDGGSDDDTAVVREEPNPEAKLVIPGGNSTEDDDEPNMHIIGGFYPKLGDYPFSVVVNSNGIGRYACL